MHQSAPSVRYTLHVNGALKNILRANKHTQTHVIIWAFDVCFRSTSMSGNAHETIIIFTAHTHTHRAHIARSQHEYIHFSFGIFLSFGCCCVCELCVRKKAQILSARTRTLTSRVDTEGECVSRVSPPSGQASSGKALERHLIYAHKGSKDIHSHTTANQCLVITYNWPQNQPNTFHTYT